MTESAIETLEALVDRTSITIVLNCLATMCHEKAGHLRSNPDQPLAKIWERNGKEIARCEQILQSLRD